LSLLRKELSDLKIDINPRRWISPYHNTSILHLILMVLFYHAVGVLLLLVGSAAIQFSVNGHVGPSIPRYLAPVLGAGPIEESIFFGIPYYATGNQFVVIVSGVTWVVLHIFNTKSMDVVNLSYSNWLFVMPSFFYSLRTWISGKGWFAILAHSMWNGLFFMLGCAYNEYPCAIFPSTGVSSLYPLVSIVLSATIVVSLTFIFYKRRCRIRAETGKSR
jgi:hypothetical protein